MFNIVAFLMLVFAVTVHVYQIDSDNSLICADSAEKLTNQQALDFLSVVGIGVSSYGFCYDQNNPICTSMEGINCITLCHVSNLKKVSKCNVGISAGTEVGHDKTFKPHTDGYRVDIKVEHCNYNFITRNYTRIQSAKNGAPQYADKWGNIFALEGTNWNVLSLICPQI